MQTKNVAFAFVVAIVASFLVWSSSSTGNAAAAGTGACEQTFTLDSGAGLVSVSADANYCYVAFKNTGALDSQTQFTWDNPAIASAELLVVAGGGGAGAGPPRRFHVVV